MPSRSQRCGSRIASNAASLSHLALRVGLGGNPTGPTPRCKSSSRRAPRSVPRERSTRTGTSRTAGDVFAEVLRDRPFYGDGGGLTLTGGEPTMQPAFSAALLQLARDAGIATAMETCGHTQWVVYERLAPLLDMVLFDIKHMDPVIHQAYTGMDNRLILANVRQLVARARLCASAFHSSPASTPPRRRWGRYWILCRTCPDRCWGSICCPITRWARQICRARAGMPMAGPCAPAGWGGQRNWRSWPLRLG